MDKVEEKAVRDKLQDLDKDKVIELYLQKCFESDYLKLCSNYYANYEDGSCMESCEYYNHNECPVVYVNGLITELKEQLALTEKALELACEEMIEDLQFDSEDDRHYTLQENIEYFKTMAKKEIKDSE